MRWLLFLLIVLLTTSALSLSYLRKQSDRLAIRTGNVKAVHDCVHEYLPDLSHWYEHYNAGLLLFVSPLLLNLGKYTLHRFKEWAKLFANVCIPLLIFRSLTICISITTRTVQDAKRNFGSFMRQMIFGSDSDLMFSGHIATALCLILSLRACGIIQSAGVWLFFLLLYSFFSSMTRSHYSIDVVVAWIVTPLFFDWTVNGSASKSLLLG